MVGFPPTLGATLRDNDKAPARGYSRSRPGLLNGVFHARPKPKKSCQPCPTASSKQTERNPIHLVPPWAQPWQLAPSNGMSRRGQAPRHQAMAQLRALHLTPHHYPPLLPDDSAGGRGVEGCEVRACRGWCLSSVTKIHTMAAWGTGSDKGVQDDDQVRPASTKYFVGGRGERQQSG